MTQFIIEVHYFCHKAGKSNVFTVHATTHENAKTAAMKEAKRINGKNKPFAPQVKDACRPNFNLSHAIKGE